MRNSKYFILVSLISLMYSTMAFSQSLTSNKSSVLVGETFTLTCSLGSAGAGHTVAFFADPQNGPLVSLGTRVADGSGVATLTVTALSGWVPQTSFQARDESAPGQPTSNWIVVTVSTVNPILTSSKSSVLVGETFTLTCSLGSGGAGHTVAFFADPQNEPLVSLGTRVADGSGVATLTVTALSGWTPQTSFQSRDDSAPGQPTSNWIVVTVTAISPVLTSSKSSVVVGETFTLTCSLGSGGAGHTVAFFADPQNEPLVSLGTRVADGSGVATLTVTALSGWTPQTSFQSRDDSAPGQPTSDWVDVTVTAISPVLTVNNSLVKTGENVTLTCDLGAAGAGHLVGFLGDPPPQGDGVIGLAPPVTANSSGVATLTLEAKPDWSPLISLVARDESVPPPYPESQWVDLNVSLDFFSDKTSVAVGETFRLSCYLGSSGAGHTVEFLADPPPQGGDVIGLGSNVADGSGYAFLDIVADPGWLGILSVISRDNSLTHLPTSDWLTITVSEPVNPTLSVDKTSLVVGEMITMTADLGSAGANHLVAFLASPGGGPIIGLGQQSAGPDGIATLSVAAGSDWIPQTSLYARDETAPGQPTSQPQVVSVSQPSPLVLISPIGNVAVTTEQVAFEWANPGAVNYQVIIDDHDDFLYPEKKIIVSTVTYSLPEFFLGVGKSYYWKVIADMGDGSTQVSDIGQFTFSPIPKVKPLWTPLFRLYQPVARDHFYCTTPEQRQIALDLEFIDENIEGYIAAKPFAAPGAPGSYDPNLVSIYRLYHSDRNAHYYTASDDDRNAKIADDYTYEGVIGYAYGAPNDTLLPMYRLFKQENSSPPPLNDHYFYTVSFGEKTAAINTFQFTDQGIMAYVSPNGANPSLPVGSGHVQIGSGLNTGNGNFQHFTKTNFSIPSRGLSLNFAHIYNSNSVWLFSDIRPLGPGWSHTYNAYVVTLNPGSTNQDLLVVWPDGTMHQYRYSSGNYECRTPGVYDELTVLVAGESMTIKKKNQIVYHFEKPAGSEVGYPAMLTRIEDRNGNAIDCSYETSGMFRLTQVQGPAGRILDFSYHTTPDREHLIREVHDVSGSRTLQFNYSTLNSLVEFIDAENQSHLYAYNSDDPKLHLLETVTLPENQVIKTFYADPAVEIPQVNIPGKIALRQEFGPSGAITMDYSEDGLSATATDANGIQLIYHYEETNDGYKYISRIEYPQLGASEWFWREDPNNPTLVTRTQDRRSYETTYVYDNRGNVLHIYQPENVDRHFLYNELNDVTQYTNPRNKITSFTYQNGNLRFVTDPRGTTELVRNAYGQVESIIDPFGKTTSLSYNGDGNIETISDNMLNSTVYGYDPISRVTSVRDANLHTTDYGYNNNDLLTSVTNELDQTVQFSYDQNDNLTSVVSARGGITGLEYDNSNRLKAYSNHGETSTVFAYRENGQLIRRDNPDNTQTSYGYTSAGQLQTVNTTAGDNATLGFDPNGNLTLLSEGGKGTLSFTYDGLNRLTGYSDWFNQSVQYGYDPNGNISWIRYPGNKQVDYTYTDDDRLETVRDWNGRITTYTYRLDGLLNSIGYPNGVSCSFGYDNAGRMNSKTITGPGGIIADYNFTPDGVGNHTSESIQQPLVHPALPVGSTNYNYDLANHLLSAGAVSYSYDGNGNCSSRTEGGTTVHYRYNSEYLLTAVGDLNNPEYTYRYDLLGHRREATRNQTVTRYVLDIAGPMSRVLMETDANNQPLYYYIYGLGMVARIAADGASTRYYHSDFRGSVVAMSDQTGSITHAYVYDEYGQLLNFQEENPNPFRYVGAYGVMDEGNGLYFMRARYYDPEIGRFLSEDPVWDVNLFAYASNNPVNATDPLGTNDQLIESFVRYLGSKLVKAPDWKVVRVRGYFRKNGTYVSGYSRRAPNAVKSGAASIGLLLGPSLQFLEDWGRNDLKGSQKIGRYSLAVLETALPPLGLIDLSASIIFGPEKVDQFKSDIFTSKNPIVDKAGSAIFNTANMFGLGDSFTRWSMRPSWIDYF